MQRHPGMQEIFLVRMLNHPIKQVSMENWEYLRVAVNYRGDGRMDFVAKRDTALPSIATHDEMEGHFNVLPSEWEAFQQKLRQQGWELVNVKSHKPGKDESYQFKRAKG